MYENLTIANLTEALIELAEVLPEIRITEITPAADGVCIKGIEPGVSYKYEYNSGCIYRKYSNDWRTGRAPDLMKKE